MYKNDEYYMNIALEEAKKASMYDEVPVGTVIVYQNEIIAKSSFDDSEGNLPSFKASI